MHRSGMQHLDWDTFFHVNYVCVIVVKLYDVAVNLNQNAS